MYKRILVVVDSTAQELPSARRVVQLVEGSPEVELFAPVHEPHLDGYLGNTEIYEPLRRRLVDEAKESLDRLAAALDEQGVKCTTVARWDHPHDVAVLAEAESLEADLVVLVPEEGTRHHMSASDWRLAARCPVPLLLVRGDASSAYQHVVAAVDPVHTHAKPEDLDDGIVAQAALVSARVNAKLSVVHCFTPISYYRSDDIDNLPVDDAEHALERSRNSELDKLMDRAGIDRQIASLREGKPHDVIESLVRDEGADLIVMGALSRGRLMDFLIGSTAERVLQHTNCDLLLVKPASLIATAATAD